jgi:hypothetical protein
VSISHAGQPVFESQRINNAKLEVVKGDVESAKEVITSYAGAAFLRKKPRSKCVSYV